MGHLQPLNIFLRQEIDRMRKVLSIVKTTLTDLKLAIDGTIIMNEVGKCTGWSKKVRPLLDCLHLINLHNCC